MEAYTYGETYTQKEHIYKGDIRLKKHIQGDVMWKKRLTYYSTYI